MKERDRTSAFVMSCELKKLFTNSPSTKPLLPRWLARNKVNFCVQVSTSHAEMTRATAAKAAASAIS